MVGARPNGDSALVQACLRGEAPAWERLVGRYARLVYAVPKKYGLDEDAAADVFQGTWTALWERLDEVRDHQRIGWWLITVAARLSYQQVQRIRREQARIEEHERLRTGPNFDTPAEELALARLEAADLAAAMARLPERCRHLLELLFYDPQAPSYGEIAARLGVAVDSIGPIRGRCLRHLRALLEGRRA
jgi:RNA polymerase sigma factor (sigma-70 family)